MGHPKTELVLSDEEHETLLRCSAVTVGKWRSRFIEVHDRADLEGIRAETASGGRVQALESDIRKWVKGWNENPKSFIWTKPAKQILESISRLLQQTTGAGH